MRIFNISRNPVSTIESALKPLEVPKTPVKEIKRVYYNAGTTPLVDRPNNPNYFIKMRNGIGRLMKHFSHPKAASK